MGIKGIYKELGQGKRVSLSKLAADSLESENRTYRIAIDISIWQFQAQAARGGTNPAIRTLFYRLVRLLGTPIQPLFVFDGPNKPAIKRNKRSGRGDGLATAMAKRLITLFGFPFHDAPGEGEAECAFLQQQGVVDAVLSEDVDTIMFGCTKTLRDWSSDSKTATAPTHVSLYDIHEMALADLGLDREGMVLVALMSGGDYLPDGIPGCGVKVACEAAKAGFGKSVCRLKASDKNGIQAWRESLIHELRVNERGFFKTKHKALKIPQDFPNIEVLRYYTHPVVSAESNIEHIRQKVEQKGEMHLEALREFTRETFGWDYRIGAIKFVRVLGQALLVHRMTESMDAEHVKRISGRRTHFSTDGTPELRLAYIPQEVVPIDLAREVDEVVSSGRTGLALNSDEEFNGPGVGDSLAPDVPKLFDVTKPDLAWVLEGLVKQSVPSVFREWQEKEKVKTIRKSPKKKPGVAKASKISDMPTGSLDRYLKTTKAAVATTKGLAEAVVTDTSRPLKSPTRPKVRPNMSKQSSSSLMNSPEKPTDMPVIDSSPTTPRSTRGQRQPETIFISSSPPAPTCSPSSPISPIFSSPSRSTAPASSQSNQVSESIHSILQASRVSKGLKAPPEQPQQRRQEPGSKPLLKQSSMKMFLSASQVTTTEKEEGSIEKDMVVVVDSDSDLDSVTSLPQSTSLMKRGSKDQKAPVSPEKVVENPSPKKKKKLLRASAGFFEEVEFDAEERDAELKSKPGKSVLVRWSDVSFIDLTQDKEGMDVLG